MGTGIVPGSLVRAWDTVYPGNGQQTWGEVAKINTPSVYYF
jgi:hypothetical protein